MPEDKHVQERIRWLKERLDFWNMPERAFMERLIDEAFADLLKPK